jgi:hypothetical protein
MAIHHLGQDPPQLLQHSGMKPKPGEELQMDRFVGTYFLLVLYKEGNLKVNVKTAKVKHCRHLP